MSVQSTIALARMALLFFVAESPAVSVLAGLFPAQIPAIILAGAVVVAVPPGLLIARALRGRSEDDLAERYRRSERLHLLAAAASQAGVITASLGRGLVGPLGLVVSAAGMVAGLRLLLKASTA